MTTELILLLLIVALASFVQTATGFGLALVSVPLLTAVIGLQATAPFVSIFGVIAELAVLLRYREAFSLRPVLKLIFSAAVAIPIGLYLLDKIDPTLGTKLLGAFIIAYVIYAFVTPKLPELTSGKWAFLAGFIGGLTAGLYAISGPPVIIYGNCRRWLPETFKANLQGYFLPVSFMVLFGHFLSGNVTPVLWQYTLWSLPAIALGMLLGFQLDGRINATTFNKMILILLLIIGLKLIFT